MTGLKRVLASEDTPLQSVGVAVSLVSGALAAGLGALIDSRAAAFSLLVGALLGFIVALVPMFLALRLILLVGALMVVSAVVALAVREQPVAAGLAMAVLAFAGAIWTGLPIVGMLFAALPVLIFVLVVSKAEEVTRGAPILLVILAGLLGMVPPTLLAIGLSLRDPRKADRQMVAAIWSSDTAPARRGVFGRLLILDGAPSGLLNLAAYGFVGRIARSWLEQRAEPPESESVDHDALAQGDANAAAVAAAMAPRGRLIPRDVEVSTESMDSQAHRLAGTAEGAAWRIWAASQSRGAELLGGARPRRLAVRPLLLLAGALVRVLLRPDAAVFRYGVQRAAALGLGVAVLVATDVNENVFWVVITIVAVLQANAPSTVVKVARRTVGTFGGVLAAVVASALLPKAVLVPWVALVVLVAGLAWMSRNYVVTALAAAFAVVLLYGAPTEDYVRFAGLRAIDVVIGGVIAALVARFLLPVRPRLAKRRADLVAALQSFSRLLGTRIADPDDVSLNRLAASQAEVGRTTSNLHTDLTLVADSDVVAAYTEDLESLESLDGQLFVLAVTELDLEQAGGVTQTPLRQMHDWIDQQIAAVASTPPSVSAAQ
ncbi:MAG: FUSC family protein [Actinobacteria bacterium]|nr:FUSC family protein [Actinomycetota bacterium]